jgi:hypothetical protein
MDMDRESSISVSNIELIIFLWLATHLQEIQLANVTSIFVILFVSAPAIDEVVLYHSQTLYVTNQIKKRV